MANFPAMVAPGFIEPGERNLLNAGDRLRGEPMRRSDRMIFQASLYAALVLGGPVLSEASLLNRTVDAVLESNLAGAQMGASLAGGDINGDGFSDIAIGAPLYTNGSHAREGVVFIFMGGTSGIGSGGPLNASAVLESNQAGARFGAAVAMGDVNGDGFDDLMVGAPGYSHGESEEGAVFLITGSANGIQSGDPSGLWSLLESDQAGARFGEALASGLDVDGDTFEDAVIGAPAYENRSIGQPSFSNEGTAFIFHGSSAGLVGRNPSHAATRLDSNQSGVEMGASVASVGDVNGDGLDDVLVGCPGFKNGHSGEGAAFLYLGRAQGIPHGDPATAARFESDQSGAAMGSSVAGVGDVDGDGFDDILIGAPLYDRVEQNEGAAFLFQGRPTGIPGGNPNDADAHLQPNLGNDRFGSRVARAGDVNRDGFQDVVVSSLAGNRGKISLYLGGPGGIAAAAVPTLLEFSTVSGFGKALAGVGDVNGDGVDDVLVGAPQHSNGESGEGVALLYLGQAAAPSGICVPSTSTLCIDDRPGDRRFKVEVHFQTTQSGGLSGSGTPIPLTQLGVRRGGLLWFFSQDNPEMLIKVLNACTVNSSYWVFYSAGTNVGLTTMVTDTATGRTKIYTNPDRTAAPPVQDTDAFPCT